MPNLVTMLDEVHKAAGGYEPPMEAFNASIYPTPSSMRRSPMTGTENLQESLHDLNLLEGGRFFTEEGRVNPDVTCLRNMRELYQVMLMFYSSFEITLEESTEHISILDIMKNNVNVKDVSIQFNKFSRKFESNFSNKKLSALRDKSQSQIWKHEIKLLKMISLANDILMRFERCIILMRLERGTFDISSQKGKGYEDFARRLEWSYALIKRMKRLALICRLGLKYKDQSFEEFMDNEPPKYNYDFSIDKESQAKHILTSWLKEELEDKDSQEKRKKTMLKG